MKVLSIWNTFIIILFAELALGTSPSCNDVISLPTFLNDSYQANADLIRLGAPSKIVQALYDDALIEIASSCECSPTTLDQFCVLTIFNLDYEVSVLRSTIDADATAVGSDKLFRLYNSSKVLNNLADNQKASLEFGRDHILKLTPNTSTITSPAWQRSLFPSDDVFFQDDTSAQADACTAFNAVTHPKGLTYPASSATAYVIGLVQSVRSAKLDLTVPLQILANHTAFVYNGVRCNKLSGHLLQIPVTYMEDYKKTIANILPAKSATGVEDPNDVRGLTNTYKVLFPSLISKLSALISYGDSETVLVVNTTGNAPTVTRYSVELALSSVSSPGINPLQPVNGPGGAITNSPGGENRVPVCPSGWILVSRVVPIRSSDEECCSEQCELLALSLSDPFLWSIEQESCCDDCNLFVCQNQGLLPASVPFSDAPPTTYPTTIDI